MKLLGQRFQWGLQPFFLGQSPRLPDLTQVLSPKLAARPKESSRDRAAAPDPPSLVNVVLVGKTDPPLKPKRGWCGSDSCCCCSPSDSQGSPRVRARRAACLPVRPLSPCKPFPAVVLIALSAVLSQPRAFRALSCETCISSSGVHQWGSDYFCSIPVLCKGELSLDSTSLASPFTFFPLV